MQVGNVTTPFGRRPMTLALVKRQFTTAEIKSGKTADKWKVFRDASQARALLGIQDRGLAVLDALLTLVLQACPEIMMYRPGGAVSSWRDLMAAAVVVRSMLGVGPSAYQDACEVMGPENAAATIACILERAGHINSAGGYLRDLTAKAPQGEFSLGPMLMALMRANGGSGRLAS
ncbi:plasmid replication protein RepC [Ensifer sp. MJa1]|uniref:plasmid replication protein RepC n=1 Tax=Ensifer sp. MJa1 TaxID=2919888 RepID=UPI0030089280